MKTKGEIEAAVCEAIVRFQRAHMGRGPQDIRTYLLDDLLLVRLIGVLTEAEQHLVSSHHPDKGRDLLKEVRTHLVETARPLMESLIVDITGVAVLSLHHDISTTTGEEVMAFTLASVPNVRQAKREKLR